MVCGLETESTCKHRKLDGSIASIPLNHAWPFSWGRSGESLTEIAGRAWMVAILCVTDRVDALNMYRTSRPSMCEEKRSK